jgi:hypothetical protein
MDIRKALDKYGRSAALTAAFLCNVKPHILLVTDTAEELAASIFIVETIQDEGISKTRHTDVPSHILHKTHPFAA